MALLEPPLTEPNGVAWSRADQVLTVARLAQTDLLLESFDFSGARRSGPSRVSDALANAAVARSAHGAGILVNAFSFDQDGCHSGAWFAFADSDGKKRS